jgi:hypothetical protein
MTRTLDKASSEHASGSYRLAIGSVAALGALLVCGSAVLADGIWLSVAAGAVTAVLHLLGIALTVRVFLGTVSSRLPWAVLAVLKFAIILLLLYWAVSSSAVALLPFLIGYGALPLGIVLSGFGRETVPVSGIENQG